MLFSMCVHNVPKFYSFCPASQHEIEILFIELLNGADLSKLTSKKVRKQLEEKYDEDLTSRYASCFRYHHDCNKFGPMSHSDSIE